MKFDDIILALSPEQRSHNDWRVKCPAHNGESDDSLSIAEGDDGTALLYCHGGCDYTDIVKAISTPVHSAVAPPHAKNNNKAKKSKIVATYQYTDEDGELLFEKVRLEPKSFRVRVLNGDGSFEWKIGDTRRVIYNLPAVVESDIIFIVEGEKDSDRLMSLGITATCNFDGASKSLNKPKWNPEYNQFFADKTVYILPDNDEAGCEHARHIEQQLTAVANSVRVVELPDLQPAGDISNWLDSGKTVDDLLVLCKKSENTIPHKWNVKTLANAFEELQPTEYIVNPLVPRRSLSVWFGSPGSLKSMILMDMAFSIMTSADFIAGSNEVMECKKSNILWLDFDNGNDVLRERFSAMARARNIDKNDDGFYYVSMPDPWFFAADINSQMDLRMLVDRLDIDLVIIDNLGTITGDIDENSAQMVRVIAPLRAMTSELDVSFIMIHHQRKGGANGGRAGDALRGHSVIEASLDYAILVQYDKSHRLVNIKCTKARRFAFDDFKAQYNFEHKPDTNDLDIVWFSAPALVDGKNDVYDAIISVLETNGKMTQERLKDVVYDRLNKRRSKPKITAWLKEMTDILDVIGIEKGPYNAKLMYIK